MSGVSRLCIPRESTPPPTNGRWGTMNQVPTAGVSPPRSRRRSPAGKAGDRAGDVSTLQRTAHSGHAVENPSINKHTKTVEQGCTSTLYSMSARACVCACACNTVCSELQCRIGTDLGYWRIALGCHVYVYQCSIQRQCKYHAPHLPPHLSTTMPVEWVH